MQRLVQRLARRQELQEWQEFGRGPKPPQSLLRVFVCSARRHVARSPQQARCAQPTRSSAGRGRAGAWDPMAGGGGSGVRAAPGTRLRPLGPERNSVVGAAAIARICPALGVVCWLSGHGPRPTPKPLPGLLGRLLLRLAATASRDQLRLVITTCRCALPVSYKCGKAGGT